MTEESWWAKMRQALANLPEPRPVVAREKVVAAGEPVSLPGHLARLIRDMPQPRETDPVRIEMGVIAHTWLQTSAKPEPPRPGPVGSLLGLPIVVSDGLPSRTVRVISRAGEVTHEWTMPVFRSDPPGPG